MGPLKFGLNLVLSPLLFLFQAAWLQLKDDKCRGLLGKLVSLLRFCLLHKHKFPAWTATKWFLLQGRSPLVLVQGEWKTLLLTLACTGTGLTPYLKLDKWFFSDY